ncbi:MAG: glycosyltransferase family 9 protein [Planctomycetes bacterium]|nr:glycosyltransferase family 9 protein [Planctomycetota bacterium]MCW8134869.1 glycosyltransferase family 9 protein [Planctomycetota bacterium]
MTATPADAPTGPGAQLNPQSFGCFQGSAIIELDNKRLLLIKPSALGDVVQAAATAWALKARWPGMHLTWMVNTQLEPLVAPLACVDATIGFERSRLRGITAPLTGRAELKSLTRTLRHGRFDAVLDLQGLFRSGLFAWLTGAPHRVGQRTAREGAWIFYTTRVSTPPQPVHARDRYEVLAREFDCAPPPRQDLDVTEAERADVKVLLTAAGHEGPLVAVCPGARWETKVYPPEKFAAVLDRMGLEADVQRPVLTGSPDMADLCSRIETACVRAKPVNLCGKTSLRQLTALLDISDLLLTCDSGPMHLAAAQGTRVCAVLGPTDARRTGPYGQLANVVHGKCELMPCLKRRCPGLGLKCMRGLDEARVAEKSLALLATTADKA